MTQPASGPSEAAPPRFNLKSCAIVSLFWVAGMFLAHGPTIGSGLVRVQGDLTDPRLIHYLLEHGYRCVAGDPQHSRFWDPPIFYPAGNTAAYTETMLGAAPLYWIWRLLGVPWDLAYPLWMLAVSTLNFLAAYHFFRSPLGRSVWAAAFGAFLFSFASARLAHTGHPQMLPAFYLVFVVHALFRAIQMEDPRRAARCLAGGCVAFIGQFYTSFYIAWFLVLSLGLALGWSLLLPSLRAPTLGLLRKHAVQLAVLACALGLALIPLLSHSLKAAADVGYRDYDETEVYLPRLQSWFYFGPDHWLYGSLAGLRPFTLTPARIFEHAIGYGGVTTLLSVWGLWNLRRTAWGRILGLVALTLFLGTLILPGGTSLWALAYLIVPGAKAIRAVARVSLLILLPATVGAASFLDESRWKKPLLIAAALWSLLEQGRSGPTFDRREQRDAAAAIARTVDPACEAFWYSRRPAPSTGALLDAMPARYHVDAMMASLLANKPTVNGHSGWSPPGWTFEGATMAPDEASIEKPLEEWCRKRGLDRRRIQTLRDLR